jgi:hypothetical protein
LNHRRRQQRDLLWVGAYGIASSAGELKPAFSSIKDQSSHRSALIVCSDIQIRLVFAKPLPHNVALRCTNVLCGDC